MKRIEFSGCDGSGKTSALEKTSQYLKQKGFRVLETREVGNPHIGICKDLRSLILNPEVKLDGKSMELIFAAMRIENEIFYEKIKNDYDYLLSDRGYFDHLAYGDVNCTPEFTQDLFIDCVAKYSSKPDYVLYFDVNIDEAKRRRVLRNDVVDSIELKGDEFQTQVSKRFKHHIANESTVHTIDANQNLLDVWDQIIRFLDKI